MRNFTLGAVFLLTLVLVSCGPTVEEAIKYNDAIIEKHDLITTKFGLLIDSYDKFVPEEMEKAHYEAVTITDEAISYATSLQPFGEDTSFKKGALELFKTYKSVLEVEHKRIIELLKLPESEYGQEEVTEFEKLIETAYKKINLEREKLVATQEKFSKKYNFEVLHEGE